MQQAGSVRMEGLSVDVVDAAGPGEAGAGPRRDMAWETVTSAFARQARATPNRTAVRRGDVLLTYAGLDAAANRLARQLMGQGVGRGDRVALLLPRDVDAVVAILGVLRAGAAYVPVDMSYPEARIHFIVGDCGCRVAITTSAGLSRLPPGIVSLALDAQAQAIAETPGDALPAVAGADDPIYVIYTSGSTGLPKGAAVTHRSFANLLQWYIRTLGLDGGDSTLLVSALGFDLTQKNIYAPLLVGGTLYLPDFDVFDPEAIVAMVESRSVTFLNCTPSTFLPLVEGAAAGRMERLASLRWAVLGGEPIPIRRLLPWLGHPACRGQILNSYGPTECTDICAAWAMGAANWEDPVPLGRPVDNVFLAVLDEMRRPVAPGVEGELWIGGLGVGLGYLGRPELNAERFMTLRVPGHEGRMYRTGDRVSWRADGVLDFFGRLDHQIKIRGHRVEPGEIEAALCSHADIREACVAVRRDGDAEPRLVAWLVMRQTATMPLEAGLRRYLAERLPEHMIPAAFAALPALPLSPNGKIDRQALPDIVARSPDAVRSPHGDGASEGHDMESLVLGVWRDVLGQVPASPDQNFFDAGGTSIGLARVQAAIRERTGRDLPVVELFAHPTVASLARLLGQKAGGPTAGGRVTPASGNRQAEALRRMAQVRGGGR